MTKYTERRALLPILASEEHCSNSCAGIDFTNDARLAKCLFFHEEMGWDNRRQQNGYIRLSVCKKAEVIQSLTVASARWMEVIRQSIAEGNRPRRSEAEVLLREIDRLRANEAILQSDRSAAVRNEQELRTVLGELQERMNNMALGIGTVLDGE